MLERVALWDAGAVNAAQIRKVAGDFREYRAIPPRATPRSLSGKRRGIARSRHT